MPDKPVETDEEPLPIKRPIYIRRGPVKRSGDQTEPDGDGTEPPADENDEPNGTGSEGDGKPVASPPKKKTISSPPIMISPPEQRDVICCGAHETYAECTNPCKENTCDQLKTDPKNKRICPMYCKYPGKCVCKTGYYKNSQNQCVKASDCCKKMEPVEELECTGKHMEMIGCLHEEDRRTCEKLLKKKKCSQKKSIRSELCKINQCNCKKGYYMNDNSVCVKPCKCKKKSKPHSSDSCPGPNEVRVRKWRRIDERSCQNRLVKRHKCTEENRKVYKNVCECDKGYLRDACKRCVKSINCFIGTPCECTNPCINANETWSYFNQCNSKKCPKPRWLSPTQACSEIGNYGCDCKNGYGRNPDGQCVLLEDCPKYPLRLPTPNSGDIPVVDPDSEIEQ